MNAHLLRLPATYVVTGKTYAGRKFRIITTSRLYAFGINLWRGNVWELQPSGRRKRVKSIYN